MSSCAAIGIANGVTPVMNTEVADQQGHRRRLVAVLEIHEFGAEKLPLKVRTASFSIFSCNACGWPRGRQASSMPVRRQPEEAIPQRLMPG
ncbi:protein of unknown function [Paraburkholderia dioscoreae]|uniref:Uncharacterized protein n=1 Tax=Paraburkholderia dioscoreae TaxID=2604047 RepID=A0A5Q4Z1F5_9BURK|nr:protein of unknown function [Paraburkholderia dioscoreae]